MTPLVLLFSKANASQSPYKKLKEALSSVEAFEKHYLVSMSFAYLYQFCEFTF